MVFLQRVGFPFVIANQDSPIHPMRVPNLVSPCVLSYSFTLHLILLQPLRMVEFYAFVDQSKQENKAAVSFFQQTLAIFYSSTRLLEQKATYVC